MPIYCPVCASEDYASEQAEPDGEKYFWCTNEDVHGVDGYRWSSAPRTTRKPDRGGLGAELDIWDKLLECIPADAEAHSYGEVEDVFFERYPKDAEFLQERYGHAWREGKKSENQYSMSVYLSLRLSELAKEGSVQLTWGPAEGPWSYNGVISYWVKG